MIQNVFRKILFARRLLTEFVHLATV